MKNGDKLVFLHSTEDPQTSDDTRLAVGLRMLGILPDNQAPFVRTVELIEGNLIRVSIWAFQAESPCGRYKTHEMIKAWRDAQWRARNPEHPFAYVQTALRCLDTTRQEITDAGQLLLIRQGDRTALLHENATPEEKAPIMARLTA